MNIFIGLPSGAIVAAQPTDFVNVALLKEIEAWKMEGCSDNDIVQRLRIRTVPRGYSPTSWIPGK